MDITNDQKAKVLEIKTAKGIKYISQNRIIYVKAENRGTPIKKAAASITTPVIMDAIPMLYFCFKICPSCLLCQVCHSSVPLTHIYIIDIKKRNLSQKKMRPTIPRGMR